MQEASLTSMVLFMKRVDIAGLGHCDLMNRPGSSVLARGQGAGLSVAASRCPSPRLRAGGTGQGERARGLVLRKRSPRAVNVLQHD